MQTTKLGKFKFFLFLSLFTLIASQDKSVSLEYDTYIKFHWKGALTSHSITIKTFPNLAQLKKDGLHALLFLYKFTDSTQIKVIESYTLTFGDDEANPVAETQLSSLDSNIKYYYAYVFSRDAAFSAETFMNIHQNAKEFHFKTLDIALKPMNFSFGAASCVDTGSSSPVFTNLTNEKLNFFLHMGDLHYENIDTDNVTRFYDGYYSVFNSSTQKEFFQSTPIFYIWDDHDFGEDNSQGTSPSRPAAHTTFKNFVPYGPLKGYLPEDDSSIFPDKAPSADKVNSVYTKSYTSDDPYGIFRSFLVGRCLFIMMDLRSFKDVLPKDILGNEQKVWLENQFKYASVNSQVRFVFLVSPIFWIDTNDEGEWKDYHETQTKIATWADTYVYKKGRQIMVLSGDTHAMAFDDGRNNYFGGFPVLQAAPLDSFPICAGGPYSHGVYVDRGQYSVINVQDNGTSEVCVHIQLKQYGTTLIEYDTCNPSLYPGTEGVYCPKYIVGDSPEYGWVSLIILGVIAGIVAICLLIWYCSRRYKDKKADEKAERLIEMTQSLENRDILNNSR